jgi:uncharacterized protein (DUF1015 family)
MAKVKPFTALRYTQKAGNIAELITPPYDVINSEEQKAYYAANPYNIIRLELAKKLPDDDEQHNRYIRAAHDFAAWQEEGILALDPAPAFYFYQQEFTITGTVGRDEPARCLTRSGFIATIAAEGYAGGEVLPHEETLPKHKADRLELMRHTFANFSPIFGLYSEPERSIDNALAAAAHGREPDIEVQDNDGVCHRLWVIDDAAICALIEKKMTEQKVYIADGHHRYETCSLFAAEMAAKGVTGCDYMMIALVNLYDPGLVVLPTHRLVKNLKDFVPDQFLTELMAKGFQVTAIDGDSNVGATCSRPQVAHSGALRFFSVKYEGEKKIDKDIPSFGLYVEGKFYLLQLTDKETAIAKVATDKSATYRNLDVTILHSLILEQIFNIGAAELASESYVGYTREDMDAVNKVDAGNYQLAFFLNSTLVEELLAVAAAGEKMPQKSTFFYPKIIAGLVINKLGKC